MSRITVKQPRLLVTAGPTREMLDPVRFLSNLSTGEMGYHIAREAQKKGFQVTLISGPVAITSPRRIKLIPVVSAGEMEKAVKLHFPKCDALVMTAAVCDYTPVHRSPQKIKRIYQKRVLFKRTRDILKSISLRKGNRCVIGFCLETENLEQNAIRKLRDKKLDLMVANLYGKSRVPFGRNKAKVLLIDRTFKKEWLPKMDKRKIARHLISWVERHSSCPKAAHR